MCTNGESSLFTAVGLACNSSMSQCWDEKGSECAGIIVNKTCQYAWAAEVCQQSCGLCSPLGKLISVDVSGGTHSFPSTLHIPRWCNATLSGPTQGQSIIMGSGSTLFSVEGNLSLSNLILTSNTTSSGSLVSIVSGVLESVACTFKDTNTVVAPGGGGIYLGAGAVATIQNCTFANLQAQLGGAIFVKASVLNITESVFVNNTATLPMLGSGGAIYTHKPKTPGKIDTVSCLDMVASSTVSIAGSNFENNRAPFGGAVFVSDHDKLNLTTSNFTENRATRGGVVYSVGCL